MNASVRHAVFNDGPDMPLCETGAFRLLDDVCDKMKACADAFAAERQLSAAIERAKHAIARADEARDKDAANYDKLFKKEWKALDLETEPRTAAGAFALFLFTAKY